MFAIKRLTSAAGGAERVFCMVCSELVKRGHDVTILTFDSPGGQSFFSIDSRVKRLDLGLGDSSRHAGFSETLSRIWALRRTIYTERPDVTVGFMHSMFVPLAVALAGTGFPVVGSEHIVPEHYRTRPFQYLMLILCARYLNKLTVLSPKILKSYTFMPRNLMVDIPNPVQPARRFATLGLDRASYTILSIGRFEPQKDHATLILAFSKLSKRFPLWRLRILGQGSLIPDIKSLIERLNLCSKVSLPGVVSDVSEEYIAAEIFVNSSYYESFGLATAEAMSHGLPVVGFANCPGTNELIESGKTGVLVAPTSKRVDALALSLSQLMSEPSLRQELGSAAREAMRSKYSLSQVCDKWEHLLFSVSRSE